MRPCEHVHCEDFPCDDANHGSYVVPYIDVRPRTVSVVLVSEAAPEKLTDYYYAMRGQEYCFRSARAFPSYLQTGPSFFIEKSKRKMIAEDIAAALELAR